MYSRDCAIRPGQSITIEVSNKPYVDQLIPPESNDYRWADLATIEIFDTENCQIVSASMEAITGKPGWYTYRFQTTESMVKGVYKVIVRLSTYITPPSPSGSPSTSGSSGSPDTETMTDVKVSYFTLMGLEF
jgi:hypothetical protein